MSFSPLVPLFGGEKVTREKGNRSKDRLARNLMNSCNCGPSLVNQFLRKGRRSTVQAFNIIDGSKKREGEEEDRSVNPSFGYETIGLISPGLKRTRKRSCVQGFNLGSVPEHLSFHCLFLTLCSGMLAMDKEMNERLGKEIQA